MNAYDPVLYSRLLTSLTLGFHIIFATIGVGIPILIALAEWMGIIRKDPHYTLLARRWARGFTITVAVGVVTGTAIGFQLSLLWPSFMRVAGQAIALPLFMETFAFFFEAIFLGIYLYTWDRFSKPVYHLLLLVPVMIGSSASAMFITMVNGFMNSPQGFTLGPNGVLTDIDPIAAMFNPAAPTKIAHVLASAYAASAFVLAAIAAYSLLKGRTHVYHKKALRLTVIAGFVFSIATAVVGDLSGKYLAEYRPDKLAAAEWHFETESGAPLVIGGVLQEDGSVKYGLTIPYALSILAHGTPNSTVTGLHEFPPDERPPLVSHYLFDLMVLGGIYMTFIGFVYVLAIRLRSWNPHHPLLLRMILWGGPIAMLSIELGWIFSEVGRQPWILFGYMKTAEGATTSGQVDTMLVVFTLLYIVLAFTCMKVLQGLFRKNTPEQELAAKGLL
ncbi:cytochrome ubiquinol oxidase subunit I [Paenibacillus turpanensis]|uniref:cytochrome ubiquinol oxidase subunit I n=1 Tax=Paenibacillus turpanensis TaxID=2689078 RepID=UPI00140D3E04|nr:cytochrome ubiquinol oxidase subunit I [Paenibacillus turpanensis]